MVILINAFSKWWHSTHVEKSTCTGTLKSAHWTYRYNSKNIYISLSINYHALLQEFKTHLSIVSQSKKYVYIDFKHMSLSFEMVFVSPDSIQNSLFVNADKQDQGPWATSLA